MNQCWNLSRDANMRHQATIKYNIYKYIKILVDL